MAESDENDEGIAAYTPSSMSETEDMDGPSGDRAAGSSASSSVGPVTLKHNFFPGTSHYTDVNLSNMNLDSIPKRYENPSSAYCPSWVKSLALHHNRFTSISRTISVFSNLVALDLSDNSILELPESICRLKQMKVLLLKNNSLDSNSFPKSFVQLSFLEVLNISGNNFQELPPPVLDLPMLKALYAGGNQLRTLPCKIGDMLSLEVLYLGGNNLKEIPATIGKLKDLASLVLCDNRLETIPGSIANLQKLESLSLHNNNLTVLPTEILTLKNLQQLSIRSNPLVARFIRDMTFDPPSLKELAGRVIKIRRMEFREELLPRSLLDYLDSAHQCVNPKCKGVYFEARVEHVKFTDFCGKYRVPFMQYLCSPKCGTHPAYAMTESSAEESEAETEMKKKVLKKVLLG